MANDAPFFFIVNPRAGAGGRKFAGIAARMRALGVSYAAAATTKPGDARTLSKLALGHGFRAIVCVGGDGTVNEVVNGFVTPEGLVDRRAVLGVIPSGTMQDFARGASLPVGRDAALARLLDGRESAIDVGRIRFADGRVHVFVNVVGAGFDAEVAGRAADVRGGAITSIPAHVLGFASALAAYQNKEISLTFEDQPGSAARLRCNAVIAANGPSYAGVMNFAPGATLDDGRLDVVLVGDVAKIELLLNLPRVLAGTHVAHEKVTTYRVRGLSLESGDDALVQADGEVVGRLPARVDVLPGALRLIR
ncbi:MAG TPA: diacylglycerol kinase family protein [Chloroflexota bacterium]|nr:diacylglycerol kinase family protein [Chloroflexota bacterium]